MTVVLRRALHKTRKEKKNMTREEFNKVLDDHKQWLDTGATSESEGKKIQLDYEVVSGIVMDFDFAYAVTNRCIFRNVTFVGCKFTSTRMEQCSFFGCTFRNCNFNNSDFEHGMFYSCEFMICTFINCRLAYSMISFTVFYESTLSMCNFKNSSIMRSDFETTKFGNDTRFEGAGIECSHLPDEYYRILGKVLVEPIIGYKKTREGVVIKAEIPAGAIVFSINGKKCRTNRAKIVDMRGRTVLHSSFDINFRYELGQEIEILDFDPCYSHECAPGFHFFMTEKEAEEYQV